MRSIRGFRMLAAVAVLSTSAVASAEYTYIVSGETVVAETNGCSAAMSPATTLDGGSISVPASEGAMIEARFFTWLESVGSALKSTRFCGLILRIL